MQVFVPFASPYETARCLDKRRLNKQIIEARQILSAIRKGDGPWAHHPVVLMWREHWWWLACYLRCLVAYRAGETSIAQYEDHYCREYRPDFLTSDFCDQHKRRLFTKDSAHYVQFAHLGTSDENWYFVDGRLVRYANGKKLDFTEPQGLYGKTTVNSK